MLLTLIICALTVFLMAGAVLIKPYIQIKRFNLGLYWVVCLVGALTLIATGCIDIGTVWAGITADTSVNPLKILTLFLSMTLLSVYLGSAGFFDYVADLIFRKLKGSQFKLFFGLYAVVSVLTVFTSNDIIILTFTPAICLFAKKARISPIPFLVGEFIAANTWSMALIVGNPTNVYLATSQGIGFAEYLSVMALPALVGGLTSLAVLLLLFYKQLKKPITSGDFAGSSRANIGATAGTVKLEKPKMIVAIFHLLFCIVLLSIADFIGAEMWLICFGAALSMSLFDFCYGLIRFRTVKPVVKSIRKAPYELVPFVLSMFVLVLALRENGVTAMLSDLFVTGGRADGLHIGIISAMASNFLNNIPMSVLFESIVSSGGAPAVYGAIVGSNIGAFITPVGALAGIMWNKILARHEIRLPFVKFVFYGTVVAIPTILTTLFTLFFMV